MLYMDRPVLYLCAKQCLIHLNKKRNLAILWALASPRGCFDIHDTIVVIHQSLVRAAEDPNYPNWRLTLRRENYIREFCTINFLRYWY